MVTLLEDAGIATLDRPPIWAWVGTAAPRDVDDRLAGLLSAHDLTLDQYIVEFDAPADHVVRTDYGEWCDVYFDAVHDGGDSAEPRSEISVAPSGDQMTFGSLPVDWITDITPLEIYRR